MSAPALIGTVFATPAQLRAADAHADKLRQEDVKHAARVLPIECYFRHVEGEDRYYQSPTRFATVRNKRVRWFTIREDGHTYADKA